MAEKHPDGQTMEDLGQFLRQERERRHLSIEEVSTRTRIRLHYVQAMEENHFDHLPHRVSAKGFLRCYASALGLDEGEVLKRFVAVQPIPEVSATFTKEKPVPSYIRFKRVGAFPLSFWITAWVIGILLLLGIWFRMTREDRPQKPKPSAKVSSPLQEAPSVDPPPQPTRAVTPEETLPLPGQRFEPTDREAPLAVTSRTPEADHARTPPSGALTLDVEAMEPSWVHVVIDDAKTQDILLKVGDKVTWQANGEFLLTVGNAGGVRAYFNGQEIERIGPSGKVVRDIRLARDVSPQVSSSPSQ